MNEKVDKFYELAYGDLTPEERFGNGHKNRMFILEHLDEIESYYDDCMKKGSGVQHEGVNEQQIIQRIIDKLRTKQITPQQIGQATINALTTAKKAAEQVENGENTIDNIIEGEEPGDDN